MGPLEDQMKIIDNKNKANWIKMLLFVSCGKLALSDDWSSYLLEIKIEKLFHCRRLPSHSCLLKGHNFSKVMSSSLVQY